MDDETVDGVSLERINTLIAEASQRQPERQMNLTGGNTRKITEIAEILGWTTDETINWIIDMGLTHAYFILDTHPKPAKHHITIQHVYTGELGAMYTAVCHCGHRTPADTETRAITDGNRHIITLGLNLTEEPENTPD